MTARDDTPAPLSLSRREAVKQIALMMGIALVGSRVILGAEPAPEKAAPGFTDLDRALLDEIGETIIPGSKATGIGAFMAMMVTDCYDGAHHAVFAAGLGQVDQAAQQRHGRSFLACTPDERSGLLGAIDAEHRTVKGQEGTHYFGMMKQLAVLGYFSSEIGCTQSLRYIEVPGSFNGNYPYKKGDKAWYS